MWPFIPAPPLPARSLWPGRRVAGVIDALAWPGTVALALSTMVPAPGVILPTFLVLCCAVAWAGARRAWRVNSSYRFTTWRIAVAIACVIALSQTFGLAVSLN